MWDFKVHVLFPGFENSSISFNGSSDTFSSTPSPFEKWPLVTKFSEGGMVSVSTSGLKIDISSDVESIMGSCSSILTH